MQVQIQNQRDGTDDERWDVEVEHDGTMVESEDGGSWGGPDEHVLHQIHGPS
jgi:hypothetical protein